MAPLHDLPSGQRGPMVLLLGVVLLGGAAYGGLMGDGVLVYVAGVAGVAFLVLGFLLLRRSSGES